MVRNCDLEYVMSRSYRRPYAAISGFASAKNDKRMAHRGVRRKQNLALKTSVDYESLLPPHRFECASNNTYSLGPRRLLDQLQSLPQFRR